MNPRLWRSRDPQLLSSLWFKTLVALQVVSLPPQTQQGHRGVAWSVTHLLSPGVSNVVAALNRFPPSLRLLFVAGM